MNTLSIGRCLLAALLGSLSLVRLRRPVGPILPNRFCREPVHVAAINGVFHLDDQIPAAKGNALDAKRGHRLL